MPFVLALDTFSYPTGKLITQFDETGDLSPNNLTGWGIGNALKSQVTQSKIEITLPYTSQVGAVINSFALPYEFPQTNSTANLLYPAVNFVDSGLTVTAITAGAISPSAKFSTITFSGAHGLSIGDGFVIQDLTGTNTDIFKGGWIVRSVPSGTEVTVEEYNPGPFTILTSKVYKLQATTAEKFLDGIYTFKETIKVSDNVSFFDIYTATFVHLQVATTACKIDEFTNRVFKHCACEDATNELWQMIDKVNAMLFSVRSAWKCGQYTTSENILKQLNKILDNECGCSI